MKESRVTGGRGESTRGEREMRPLFTELQLTLCRGNGEPQAALEQGSDSAGSE